MRVTRTRLVDEALALLDEQGEASLTMRNLADRVDRRVSSLYHHVSGRAELVELIRARLVAKMDTSRFASCPWDEALRHWARSYLQVFAAHPSAIALLATAPLRDHSTYRMYDVVVEALVRGGWEGAEAVGAMRAVESFIMGSSLDLGAPADFLTPEALPQDVRTLGRVLVRGADHTYSAPSAFEIGLDALILGLQAQVADRGGD